MNLFEAAKNLSEGMLQNTDHRPGLFLHTFTEGISNTVFKRNSDLLGLIAPMFPSMPTPTKPGEFFKQDTPGNERTRDSDVDWIAIWNAKMRQARTEKPELFEEPIHAAISSGEELMGTLNVDALTKSRVLIEADLEGASTSFEGLYRSLFGARAGHKESVTTVAAAESLRHLSPIKDIAVLDLFAWQIPHLLPSLAHRSKSLGGHYWTLLSLQWLVRWHEKSERNECPPKQRDPWILMRRYAERLGT